MEFAAAARAASDAADRLARAARHV
jgi:hypothetical protein